MLEVKGGSVPPRRQPKPGTDVETWLWGDVRIIQWSKQGDRRQQSKQMADQELKQRKEVVETGRKLCKRLSAPRRQNWALPWRFARGLQGLGGDHRLKASLTAMKKNTP